LNELADELPDCGNGGIGLFAQPFAQLVLVGEVFDAGQLADQRFGVQSLGIGQTGPAGAETVEQLGDDQFGAVAMRRARARIQAGERAKLFP
jgi:hypothetical protein